MQCEHMVEVYTSNYIKSLDSESSHCRQHQLPKMSDKEEDSHPTEQPAHPQAVENMFVLLHILNVSEEALQGYTVDREEDEHVFNYLKAGGMRIVQDKSRLKKKSTSEDATVPQVDGVPHVQNSPPKAAAYLKDDNVEFSPKAVQAFHDKPQPSRAMNESSKPHVLHQPRK